MAYADDSVNAMWKTSVTASIRNNITPGPYNLNAIGVGPDGGLTNTNDLKQVGIIPKSQPKNP